MLLDSALFPRQQSGVVSRNRQAIRPSQILSDAEAVISADHVNQAGLAEELVLQKNIIIDVLADHHLGLGKERNRIEQLDVRLSLQIFYVSRLVVQIRTVKVREDHGRISQEQALAHFCAHPRRGSGCQRHDGHLWEGHAQCLELEIFRTEILHI